MKSDLKLVFHIHTKISHLWYAYRHLLGKNSKQTTENLFQTQHVNQNSITAFVYYLCVWLLLDRFQACIILQEFEFLVATVFITNMQNI